MNLQNNSEQMKTIVETFIIEETAPLIYDNERLEKWNAHIEELGLKGQTKIVQKEKSPIPFMFMNQTTKAVFETLCPRKVKAEEFDISPIPVEILDLMALSKKEGYFDKIEIWYDDKTPDPVCVGLTFNSEADRASGYWWNAKHYLLGKWSDVKAPFEVLRVRAQNRFKNEELNRLKQNVLYAQRQIEDLDLTVAQKFGSDNQLNF